MNDFMYFPYDITTRMHIASIELNRSSYMLYIDVADSITDKIIAEIEMHFHSKIGKEWTAALKVVKSAEFSNVAMSDLKALIRVIGTDLMDFMTDEWGLFEAA